jgi:hypothetical protein
MDERRAIGPVLIDRFGRSPFPTPQDLVLQLGFAFKFLYCQNQKLLVEQRVNLRQSSRYAVRQLS